MYGLFDHMLGNGDGMSLGIHAGFDCKFYASFSPGFQLFFLSGGHSLFDLFFGYTAFPLLRISFVLPSCNRIKLSEHFAITLTLIFAFIV